MNRKKKKETKHLEGDLDPLEDMEHEEEAWSDDDEDSGKPHRRGKVRHRQRGPRHPDRRGRDLEGDDLSDVG